MSQLYQWALNVQKLNRAIAECAAKKITSEEGIKARYVEMGGKLLTDNGEQIMENNEDKVGPAVVNTPAEAAPVSVEEANTTSEETAPAEEAQSDQAPTENTEAPVEETPAEAAQGIDPLA